MPATRLSQLKFHADGTFKEFRGNTILSALPSDSPLASQLIWAQTFLAGSELAQEIAPVPPSSFHMTIFELLCDRVREPDYWSSLFDLSAPIEFTDAVFASVLTPELPKESLAVTPGGVKLEASLALTIEPADQPTAQALRALRDRLASLSGVRFPNHSSYQFHITFAYLISCSVPADHRVLLTLGQQLQTRLRELPTPLYLPPPEIYYFEDMSHYSRARQKPSGSLPNGR